MGIRIKEQENFVTFRLIIKVKNIGTLLVRNYKLIVYFPLLTSHGGDRLVNINGDRNPNRIWDRRNRVVKTWYYSVEILFSEDEDDITE